MKKLNYKFSDEKLLELAMTQSGADASNNNERLEFLGDRVLGLSVATMLFDMFPSEAEGELARRHSVLVSTETLAHIAKELGYDKQLRHGHMTGGRLNHILANAMEAIFGAMFIDGGFEAARSAIIEIYNPLVAAQKEVPKDPKTALQEFAQHSGTGKLPVYRFLENTGKMHAPIFNVEVSAVGQSATGSGGTKKSATVAAAKELLRILNIEKV